MLKYKTSSPRKWPELNFPNIFQQILWSLSSRKVSFCHKVSHLRVKTTLWHLKLPNKQDSSLNNLHVVKYVVFGAFVNNFQAKGISSSQKIKPPRRCYLLYLFKKGSNLYIWFILSIFSVVWVISNLNLGLFKWILHTKQDFL